MSHLIIGVAGLELTAEEKDWLARPDIGGVTLFKRNIDSVDQVEALIAAIRDVDADALLTVDQEGGRIQRLHSPCTELPALGALGRLWESDPEQAAQAAFAHAQLMAGEMAALGFDLSFAPVLDIDAGSAVIGDRAFHRDVDIVKELGRTYIKGMHAAGMKTCGKHFPGHGSVQPDTHHEAASDPRSLTELARNDIKPFQVAVRSGLDSIMMAHVVYPDYDARPAGFSKRWIGEFLRGRMQFTGPVFCDDLGMAAAFEMGAIDERVRAAHEAGCDYLLVCRPDDVRALLESSDLPVPGPDRRRELLASHAQSWAAFRDSDERAVLTELLNESMNC